VYLFVEVKRYRCWNCFQVFSASFESIAPNQHYTNRCCEYLYELCEGSTIILDMWEPYHKVVRALFPSASIVIDKYHVVQKVTQALDQARKEFSSLKKARFLLYKRLPESRERITRSKTSNAGHMAIEIENGFVCVYFWSVQGTLQVVRLPKLSLLPLSV
jgi:hypothetical protein